MIFGRWNISALINEYKEGKMFSELCHLPIDSEVDRDKYPTLDTTWEGMSYFKALSIYLRLSKLGMYSIIIPCERELDKDEKKERRKRILITWGICAAVLAALILVLHYTYFIPLNKYNDAVKMIYTGKYKQAIEAFEEMGDYRDAPIRVKQAQASRLYDEGKLNEAYIQYSNLDPKYNQHKEDYENIYNGAVKQIESGEDYDQAITTLQGISYYKDSLIRIRQAEANRLYDAGQIGQAYDIYSSIDPKYNQHSKDYEIKYNEANQLQKDGKLAEAAGIYQSLGMYKDSNEKCREVANLLIEQYEQEKDFAKVREIYLNLGMDAEAEAAAVKQDKEQKYREAMKLMEEQKYGEAAALFYQIEDYENSLELAQENKYREARVMLNNGEYEQAIATLETIQNYKDAASLIKQTQANMIYVTGDIAKAYEIYATIDESYNQHLEEYQSRYNTAEQKYNEGQLQEAFNLYHTLGAYKDSNEKWRTIGNLLIEQYESERSYAKAAEIYQILGMDAEAQQEIEKQRQEDDYQQAIALMNSADYVAASNSFMVLGDYENSQALKNECDYLSGKALMDEGFYTGAIDSFRQLGNYKDSQMLTNECMYLYAAELVSEDSLSMAEKIYRVLGGYRDAAQKADEIKQIYIDQMENDMVFSVGNTFIFGRYEQDGITENGKEPLEWIVIWKSKNTAVITTKYAIECLKYQSPKRNITWEHSMARSWLNNDFYYNAFTETERESICRTAVSNTFNDGKYNTASGRNTYDYIYLLSYYEVSNYFKSDEERKLIPTEVAKKNGAHYLNCYWMTRSPGAAQDQIMAVKNNGQTNYSTGVDDSHLGVRPAMWIKLDEPSTREAMFAQGSIVSFGGTKNSGGVFVPMHWRVIDKEENAVTLLAEKVVDNLKFNEEKERVTWVNSSLRQILNSTFISSVFNVDERNSLMTMKVKLDVRDGIEGYRSMPTTDVEDKVTLLSYKQAQVYLGDKEQRKMKATEYAAKQGAGNGNTEYWLTSMGRNEKTMGIINGNGDPDSRSVTDKKGVLPMIKVSLSFGLE